MQGAIARLCVVVAAAILNHPLLLPHENATLPEQDEELVARMREHEETLERERAKLQREISQQEGSPQQQQEEEEEEGPEAGYGWYFWSAASFIVFLAIEMCRVDPGEAEVRPPDDEDAFADGGPANPGAPAPDKDVLRNFCDKCAHTSARDNWRVREFAEGFADDLLEALRGVCDGEADVGDFVRIGSMFESWKACKPLTCDLLVPLAPPEPHSLQFQLWCGPDGDVSPDLQGCGRVKVSRPGEGEDGCLCGSAHLAEDILCLLHHRSAGGGGRGGPVELLCARNSRFLAKERVAKWFQVAVTRAWARISHKYDFEANFRSLDAAGALKVRFRSGKAVTLNLIPAVQLDDTDAFFVTHFPSDGDPPPDPHWPLSLAVYERSLLRLFTRRLPPDSCHLHCLQIATFLHRKQTGLTGPSGLTNYHWKTAVLHLLLSKRASAWGAESVGPRLRDVLGLLLRSLREKRLRHVLVGNRKVPDEILLPEALRRAEPVNLFRSLVLRTRLHAATVAHVQEMLRNAPVLLQEYTPHSSNGGSPPGLEERF